MDSAPSGTAPELRPLADRRAHPYSVPLGPGPRPEVLLSRLGDRPHPGALWGDWFDGGVVLVHSPLRVVVPDEALDAAATLEDQPHLPPAESSGSDLVGGGWLVTLGYSPGTSWLGFYDSVLRWRGGAWTFESLGLEGHAEANAAAVEDWRRLLDDDAPTPTWDVGTFSTMSDPRQARQRHLAAVEHGIGRIHRGDFYQVNLCTRLRATFDGDPVSWFAELAAELQPAWGALVTAGEDASPGVVVSLSPELFLRLRGDRVTTSPIKGTAPRGQGETDSPALRASAKDAAENIMIVDLMRNDLSRVSRPGSVLVEDLLALEPHPGVWHLVSRISGRLRPENGPAALLRASFPPGSVTGAPKVSAVRAIAELEDQPRGAYTGAVGFCSPLAGMDLNVAIRTFEVTGGEVQLGVGGGITADSVPVREWAECLDKAAPLVAASSAQLAPDLVRPPSTGTPLAAGGVFETMLSHGPTVLRLAAHLARLDRSCRELYGEGVPADLPARVTAASAQLAAESGRHAVRVHASPGRSGLTFAVTTTPLGARTAESRLVLGRRGPGPWRHKWHDRTALNRAEGEGGDRHPYFLSADGHVAETSRGNLFCRTADGHWLTAPLDEDLLPGVTRRDVLDLFVDLGLEVDLRPFGPDTLRSATAAFWTSSLSGAVTVSEVDGTTVAVDQGVVDLVNTSLGFSPPARASPGAATDAPRR